MTTRIFAKPRPRRPVSMGPTQSIDFAAPQNRFTISGAPMEWETTFSTSASDKTDTDSSGRPGTRNTMDWRPQTRDTMDWRPTTRDTMDWRPSTQQGPAARGPINIAARPAQGSAPKPAVSDPLDDLTASLGKFLTEENDGTEKGVHGKFRKFFRPFLRR